MTRQVETSFATLPQPWSALAGQRVLEYEIRHGESIALQRVREAIPGGLGYVAGPVLGVSVHGLFENPGIVAALVGRVPALSLDAVLDGLAEIVEQHLDVTRLLRTVGM
jgi:adenosylcobyric acid synthase